MKELNEQINKLSKVISVSLPQCKIDLLNYYTDFLTTNTGKRVARSTIVEIALDLMDSNFAPESVLMHHQIMKEERVDGRRGRKISR